MLILPVYYRKSSYDGYGKLNLRIVLPHQNFEEQETIRLLFSNDFSPRGFFFLNTMSRGYITESISTELWARYKDLK